MRKRSWPAVSQIVSLTFLWLSWMTLALKSTPIVGAISSKPPVAKRRRRLLLPTPLSPTKRICAFFEREETGKRGESGEEKGTEVMTNAEFQCCSLQTLNVWSTSSSTIILVVYFNAKPERRLRFQNQGVIRLKLQDVAAILICRRQCVHLSLLSLLILFVF